MPEQWLTMKKIIAKSVVNVSNHYTMCVFGFMVLHHNLDYMALKQEG
jgi:hypothetical protein